MWGCVLACAQSLLATPNLDFSHDSAPLMDRPRRTRAAPTHRPRTPPRLRLPPLIPVGTARAVLQNRLIGADDGRREGVPLGTESEITPEIYHLARGLRTDARLIFEWVRNNIDFTPSFGSKKGATMTYVDGCGNAFDQAALLAALFRASGFEASFLFGTVSVDATTIAGMLGVPEETGVVGRALGAAGIPADLYVNGAGELDRVELEHVWVGLMYQGTLYQFDPAVKAYAKTPGIDLPQVTGYTRGALLNDAFAGMNTGPGYVRDVNRSKVREALDAYTSNLIGHVRQQLPEASVAEIMGGRSIVPVRGEPIRTQLPGHTVQEQWQNIPVAYLTLVRLEHFDIDLQVPSAMIYGRRLVLYYTAADEAVIALDGTRLATHTPLGTGATESLIVTVDHPYAADGGTYQDETQPMNPRIGGVYFIASAWGGVSRRAVERRRYYLRRFLDMGLPNASEAVAGESLALIGLTYMAQVSRAAWMGDRVSGMLTVQHHELGIVGQTETPFMDMALSGTSMAEPQDDMTRLRARLYAFNGMKSAFEGLAIDQMVPPSAVSTTKLLDQANADGLRVFGADSANYTAHVQPNLTAYNSSTKQEIETVIANGATVFLPERGDLQDGAWRGAAYIQIPPDGLGMANQIDGGVKGGYGNEAYYVDGLEIVSMQEIPVDHDDHSKSKEPVDLVTGHYLRGRRDLTVGTGPYPFELAFTRRYSSAQNLTDGRLGYGWTDNWHFDAQDGSDAFRVLGDASPVEAAAAVVGMLVAIDIFSDGLQTDRLVTATVVHRWLADQLVDNAVTVATPDRTTSFLRLFDGRFQPPPGEWARLEPLSGGGWRFVTRKGAAYEFGAEGTLQRWRDLNGNTVTLTQGPDGPQSVASSLGRSLNFTYSNGRIDGVSDARGLGVHFEYDSAGDLVRMIDPVDEITRYEYDGEHRLVAVYPPHSPAEATVNNGYDTFGRVIEQTVAGETYVYYYARNRTEEMDPAGNSRLYRFDRYGNTIARVDPLGSETRFDYDGQFRLERMTLPEGNGREYTYEAQHNLATVVTFPTPGSGLSPTTETFEYDLDLNRVTRYTNAAGKTVTCAYDDRGNLVRKEMPGSTGIEPVVEYTVTETGQVQTQTGPDGVVSRYHYDAYGQPVSIVTDEGGQNITTAFGYDPVGNVITMTDPRGNSRRYEYDDVRRVVGTTAPDPFGYRTEYRYDGRRQPVAVLRDTGDPETPRAETVYEYTPFGARSSVTGPEGRTTSFQYDALHCLNGVTDNAGNTIAFEYDELGRPKRQIDALQHVVEEHTYTPNGHTASIRDADGNPIQYEYGGFGGRRKVIYPDDSFVEMTFDATGNRLTEKTRSGTVISYTYDALGRLKTRTVPGVGTDTFTYGRLGRVTSVDGPAGTFGFAYDAVGHVTSETSPGGYGVVSEYDTAGNRTRVIYPDGTPFRYVYDELNRLTEIRDSEHDLVVAYAYDGRSRLESRWNANGTSSMYGYNEDGTVATIKHQFDGASVTYTYNYEAAGHLSGVEISNPAFAPAPSAARDLSLAANELNQAQFGAAYEYDQNGNLIGDGVNRYTFDPRNRLTTALTPRYEVQYEYDALDRRMAVTVDGRRVRCVHDGARVIEEHDVAGNLIRRYVHGPGWDNPVRLTTAEGEFFYHRDAIGSIVALTDFTGTVVETHGYTPFGKPSGDSTTGNRRLFTGREYDAETGLYYYRARYYSPEIAAFLSPDPSGTRGGDVNLYAYAYNSPQMYLDPTGEWVVAGIVAGAAVLFLGSGYAVDHVEVSQDPLGGEAAAFGPWITVGPTFKKQHPVVQESMLVHERTHKWSFHGFQVWKTEYDKEYEAYKAQYEYLQEQRQNYLEKGDLDTVAAIDQYVGNAVIETYVTNPEVLEAIAPRKSVLGRIGDFFHSGNSTYNAPPPVPPSSVWPPSSAMYHYQE